MKKILIAAVIALAAVSLRADADGYVMLSGITPGQLPAPSSAIHGGRLSLIYGECRELYGLDIGVSGYVRERMYGAQFGVVLNYVDIAMGFQSCFANYVEHEFYGFQVGAWNHAEDGAGMQLGIVNTADSFAGFQLGLFNWANDLDGLQLGLVNVIADQAVPVLPFINVGW